MQGHSLAMCLALCACLTALGEDLHVNITGPARFVEAVRLQQPVNRSLLVLHLPPRLVDLSGSNVKAVLPLGGKAPPIVQVRGAQPLVYGELPVSILSLGYHAEATVSAGNVCRISGRWSCAHASAPCTVSFMDALLAAFIAPAAWPSEQGCTPSCGMKLMDQPGPLAAS
jgi:hypothetical protein